MAIEIERKFLIKDDSFKLAATNALSIEQGYLSSGKDCIVRIRIVDNHAVLTIKNKNKKNSITHHEWEYPIPLKDAREMLYVCNTSIIEKTRYIVPAEQHEFEVDVFHGTNKGLVIAEIELSTEDESYNSPSWLGKEVTSKKRFHNINLAMKPFSTWKNKQKNPL